MWGNTHPWEYVCGKKEIWRNMNPCKKGQLMHCLYVFINLQATSTLSWHYMELFKDQYKTRQEITKRKYHTEGKFGGAKFGKLTHFKHLAKESLAN